MYIMCNIICLGTIEFYSSSELKITRYNELWNKTNDTNTYNK